MWPPIKTTTLLYLSICIFRVANTFLVQSFFDPDEYWQTLEPAYCEVFLRDPSATANPSDTLNLDCAGYTWEWKRRTQITSTTPKKWIQSCLEGPIRSYLSVLPTHMYYTVLQKCHWDTHFLVSQGPMILVAIIAAAPTDLAVWIMAHWLPSHRGASDKSLIPWFCLFCSIMSWFHGYALVRTFSNSLETMCLTVSMALIAPEFFDQIKTAESKSRTVRHCLCFLLGGFSVAMRFSSVTAYVPIGILLANEQKTWLAWCGYLIRICALFGALGIFLACGIDRYFYGFWTIPFLGSFHFNVVLGNSLLYGSHPWHWYFTAGIPAVTGLWLPLLLWDFGLLVMRNDAMNTARRNLWIVMFTYIIAHSHSGHKEFRFLMPILPLLCLVSGTHLYELLIRISRKAPVARSSADPCTRSLFHFLPWLVLLAVPNVIALLYLGLFHQSAPISVNHFIASTVATKVTFKRRISVHYLTGACHSTPLHSYLHVPTGYSVVQFDTWSLDCSPDCRSNLNVLCESELFVQDPVAFVQAAYVSDHTCLDGNVADGNEQSCSSGGNEETRTPPDFLVTYADYAVRLQPQLASLGLVEVARFPHGINGLRVGNAINAGDGYQSDLPTHTFRRVGLAGDFVELSIDEMVLFASPDLM